MNDHIQLILKSLPEKPGVYKMLDDTGTVIYVGKAKVLRNRVRQYFQSSKNHSPKVRAMVSHIADFETIEVHSEVEALSLESNLIKEYMPKYNILLKDDKHFPYFRIDLRQDFPQITECVRQLMVDVIHIRILLFSLSDNGLKGRVLIEAQELRIDLLVIDLSYSEHILNQGTRLHGIDRIHLLKSREISCRQILALNPIVAVNDNLTVLFR